MATLEAERENVSPNDEQAQTETFDMRERCDYCGAQAKHKAIKGEQVLYFCKHDARKHGEALVAKNFKIVPPGWDSFE